MPLPDYGFDDFLDDECGAFVSGYSDGHYDVRITTCDGEFFFCVAEEKLSDFMRNFFSGNGIDFFRF